LLGDESRCVAPFTRLSESEALADGSHPPVWFAFDDDRPLAFFAVIWTRWTTVRKVKEGETSKTQSIRCHHQRRHLNQISGITALRKITVRPYG